MVSVGDLVLRDLGPWTFVAVIVLMILTNKLLTRKQYEDAREDAKAWRAIAEKRLEVNTELAAAVQELLPLARATHHALTSIQSLGRAQSPPPEENQT